MAQPKVLILRSPGTNCDEETAYAFEIAGGDVCSLHINELIKVPKTLEKFQILCFPGGFSYGDDIAAGRILASRIQNHLLDLVELFREEDRLMLGICNGFQVMMRMGVFFDPGNSNPPATLTWNNQGRFEDRWVHLACGNDESPFLRGIETIYLPMAHAEGRLVLRDRAARDVLVDQNQIALRYTEPGGGLIDEELPFPTNPNGAELNAAGLCDETGRFLGLMPHPERHLFATHHPNWTRQTELPDHGEGFQIFKNAIDYFA